MDCQHTFPPTCQRSFSCAAYMYDRSTLLRNKQKPAQNTVSLTTSAGFEAIHALLSGSSSARLIFICGESIHVTTALQIQQTTMLSER